MKPATPSHGDESGQRTTPHTQWVVQAQAGDRLAFHRLVDRYQPEIFRMIFYRTRSRMDAEDLTQDVFLKAFNNLRGLQSPAVFRSWLYRIAVNRVRDYLRKKRFRSFFKGTSTDDETFHESREMAEPPRADRQIARKEFWQRIEQAMETLSAMERETFMLRFFDHLSIKDVSTALKKNESTVKTHLYRAMKKMQDALADMDGILEGL